jgi:hypothetical protein
MKGSFFNLFYTVFLRLANSVWYAIPWVSHQHLLAFQASKPWRFP